jgi:hypothetical protein
MTNKIPLINQLNVLSSCPQLFIITEFDYSQNTSDVYVIYKVHFSNFEISKFKYTSNFKVLRSKNIVMQKLNKSAGALMSSYLIDY